MNVKLLEKQYFYFDTPVPYKIDDNNYIEIKPVLVKDSEFYASSLKYFTIDKNEIPDPKIIQMSYLQFVIEVLFAQDEDARQAMINICRLCLGIETLAVMKNDMGRYMLVDVDRNIYINSKQFDEIRSIILHQNDQDYDDEYINPDLKKALEASRELRLKGIDYPNIERRIAIITSHCGLPKQEQLKMTYRSHNILFREICGEVRYTTITPVAMFGGKGKDVDDWIFCKKKGKFEGEIMSVTEYSQSIGQ